MSHIGIAKVMAAASVVCAAMAIGVGVVRAQQTPAPARTGWNIPAEAKDEKSPLTVNEATLAAGKKVYAGKCQRCHGAMGLGDGADADAKYKADMDLTNPARAGRNPDGVVFYKLWNGRANPKMPTFSEELSKEQAWAVVAYVQSLRAKTP